MNAVDSRTKFNLETWLMWSRTLEEFGAFFKELKGRVGAQIHGVFAEEKNKPPEKRKLVTPVSDRLEQYKSAFNRYFST